MYCILKIKYNLRNILLLCNVMNVTFKTKRIFFVNTKSILYFVKCQMSYYLNIYVKNKSFNFQKLIV